MRGILLLMGLVLLVLFLSDCSPKDKAERIVKIEDIEASDKPWHLCDSLLDSSKNLTELQWEKKLEKHKLPEEFKLFGFVSDVSRVFNIHATIHPTTDYYGSTFNINYFILELDENTAISLNKGDYIKVKVLPISNCRRSLITEKFSIKTKAIDPIQYTR